jgi:pyruvate, water dikinase
VRSSATAEDLPDASFAGQQETFLNVHGAENVLQAIRKVFASLYNDRAISYRAHHGFAHGDVALSAAVQQMVRSDLGASGVMFTLDTESGFRDVVFITASYGLGEMVVQGAVNPDEFYVHKPMLERGRPAIVRRALGSKLQKMIYAERGAKDGRTLRTVDVPEAERHRFSLADADVLELARAAVAIEKHYRPAHGYRVGERRRGRARLRAAGAAGDGEIACACRHRGALQPQGARPRACERPGHRPQDRRGHGARGG